MSSPTPSRPTPSSPPPTGSAYRRFGVARHAAKAEPDEYDDDLDPPAPAEIRRSATVLRLVLLTLALAGVGAVAALGGFERAGVSGGLPNVKVNELVQAGTWEITIESATAGEELRDVTPDPGNYLIEVDVTMTNRREQPQTVFDRLESHGVPGLVGESGRDDVVKPKQYVLIRDNRLAFQLQPDMTERVAFIWEVKGGTPVPAQMALTIKGIYPRKTSFAILNSIISFDEPAATVTVPITDRTVPR